MGEDPLHGYRGRLREALEAAGVVIGDLVRVESGERSHEGSLMPRLETADDRHIVLKLMTGYNVGVAFDEETEIVRLGQADKPEFRPPPLPETRAGLPRVSIVSTGGTIASRVDYVTGGVQSAISSRDLLSIVPELSEIAVVDADILYSVFSENIDPDHWSGIANRVAEKIKGGAEGVVITHGTDTMGYSSAALSFALRSLPVPVIFVGSQRSSDRPSSDAATGPRPLRRGGPRDARDDLGHVHRLPQGDEGEEVPHERQVRLPVGELRAPGEARRRPNRDGRRGLPEEG